MACIRIGDVLAAVPAFLEKWVSCEDENFQINIEHCDSSGNARRAYIIGKLT